MTDNEITREKTFSEELPYFKERIKEVFDNYDNLNGNEDPLYIAVLRDSKRIVRKAEEEITRQQAEIERLKELCDNIRTDKSFLSNEITKYHKELLKSKVFKYVRNPNRIYTITDFQDGEILLFYDYPEKPNALASGHYKFQGKDDIRLLHISEVKELSYEEIKSEAVKEFAERLKEKSEIVHLFSVRTGDHYMVDIDDIDSLVKEMGENNGST